ncbi:MAG: hypothetical protein ACYDDI_03705 [Candidatus Acidiferrales bacterium]
MLNTQTVGIARALSLIIAAAAVFGAISGSVASAQQTQKRNSAELAPSAATTLPTPAATPRDAAAPSMAPLENDRQDAVVVLNYLRPTFRQRFHFYLLHTYGPIKMTELAFGSAISQADNVPPEWHQGWDAYGKRFASDVGSSAAGGTAEFALAEALRLDTKYYPCKCKGIWPRVGHALKSAITARAGVDGHRVFSVPALVAPYAGAFSTLAWYPSRYGAKDSFRTGNYDLLDSVGESIALEFLSPLLHKFHVH